ncbi:hypothetical protein [Actinomycetospora sp.]|uniref:hypothetical protein n=1 Tax=Actinomycetospora sp. TaxID=1872135 RepID=UPI002F42C252
MTTELSTERDVATKPADEIDTDRLCVAARSVLDRMSDLVAEGLTDAGVERVTRHARVLADLHALQTLSVGALREHALTVRDALTPLGGERALTFAVWIDDGLGAA